ncbi:MAG: hypothetical protein PEGG_00717 [Paraeggerthella hongkongensis]
MKSKEARTAEEGATEQRSRSGKRTAAGIAAVVLVAAVGTGIAFAAGQPVPVEANAPAASSQAPSPSPERKAEKSAVVLAVEAEGAEAGATKAKVVTTGESGKVVVAEAEVEANEAVEIGKLPEGDYGLLVTAAPVCEDGSSYKLPDKPVKFSVDGDVKDVRLEVKLEKIAADKMTKEQLEASAAALEEAGNSPAAQGVKEKSESAVSEPGSDSVVKRDPTPTPDNGNGGSSSDPAPAPTPAPDPTPAPHEHSWTPVTAQQWVANNVWVEDSPAWDKPVYGQVEREICNTCGVDVTGFANQHLLDSGRGGCSSWRSEVQQVQTGTIHHDATGQYEDRGHYETVTTGYSCSCGTTK